MFEGKKIIIFGETYQIPGASIKECLKAAGVLKENIVYSLTDCFT